MNEFYSIAPTDTPPENEFQLSNIGPKKVLFSGGRTRNDGYGGKIHTSNTVYGETKPEDYDGAFANKISRVNPPYELDRLINYHLDFYTGKGGSKDTFIKHIQYVVLPYLQKYYSKQPVYIQLTEEWINEIKRTKNNMVEYSELNNNEKAAINHFIKANNKPGATLITITAEEISSYLEENKQDASERVIDFLNTNDFVKLRDHRPTYQFIEEGFRLFKYGSIEKYYEKMANQFNQVNQQVTGNGNIVNVVTNGGNITQSGITITINQNQYSDLKEWGVDNEKIKELETIVSTAKDKPTLKEHLSKWLSAVTVSLAAKGAVEGIPKVMDFIHHLM